LTWVSARFFFFYEFPKITRLSQEKIIRFPQISIRALHLCKASHWFLSHSRCLCNSFADMLDHLWTRYVDMLQMPTSEPMNWLLKVDRGARVSNYDILQSIILSPTYAFQSPLKLSSHLNKSPKSKSLKFPKFSSQTNQVFFPANSSSSFSKSQSCLVYYQRSVTPFKFNITLWTQRCTILKSPDPRFWVPCFCKFNVALSSRLHQFYKFSVARTPTPITDSKCSASCKISGFFCSTESLFSRFTPDFPQRISGLPEFSRLRPLLPKVFSMGVGSHDVSADLSKKLSIEFFFLFGPMVSTHINSTLSRQ
jgi:hypothetical protein